jgi:hypothetical protein
MIYRDQIQSGPGAMPSFLSRVVLRQQRHHPHRMGAQKYYRATRAERPWRLALAPWNAQNGRGLASTDQIIGASPWIHPWGLADGKCSCLFAKG